MLLSFVIALLCLILTSGFEVWRAPSQQGYDLLYDPVADIFYAGSAPIFQGEPAASIRRLNGATGELIGDSITIDACGDDINTCSFVGKFAGYYNSNGSLKYIILTATSNGPNNAFALYETATDSILWTHALTQDDIEILVPENHAEPGASFSPDGSHVFVPILTSEGTVNYAFKIDGEFLFKLIDFSGITASPDSQSIYLAYECGVVQYHIDTTDQISSWDDPQCNLNINDRPTIDSEGNVYVLNKPTTAVSTGLVKLGSNLTEGPILMTTSPPPIDPSSFWFSPVLNKDETIVAVTVDGDVGYWPLTGLDSSDGKVLWNTTISFFPARQSTVYSESKKAFYTSAGQIGFGGFVSGYDETTGSSIVSPSGDDTLVYDFAIVSDERMGAIIKNYVVLYSDGDASLSPTQSPTTAPTGAPNSGAFKFGVMESSVVATIGVIIVSCFY